MASSNSSTRTPALRSSIAPHAIRSHSLTRNVASPVIRVGVGRNGAMAISVGAASGMSIMCASPMPAGDAGPWIVVRSD